jgi:heat shock protein HslJ
VKEATTVRTLLFLAILAASACAARSGYGQAGETLLDRDWALAALGEPAAPIGPAAHPPTLRLDSKEGRASGFAGCNRFSGGYELAGNRVVFGPLMSTKMACERGMDVESRYLEALGKVNAWSVDAGELVLRGGGAVLRFRAAAP